VCHLKDNSLLKDVSANLRSKFAAPVIRNDGSFQIAEKIAHVTQNKQSKKQRNLF
jgi:hypothetical protein